MASINAGTNSSPLLRIVTSPPRSTGARTRFDNARANVGVGDSTCVYAFLHAYARRQQPYRCPERRHSSGPFSNPRKSTTTKTVPISVSFTVFHAKSERERLASVSSSVRIPHVTTQKPVLTACLVGFKNARPSTATQELHPCIRGRALSLQPLSAVMGVLPAKLVRYAAVANPHREQLPAAGVTRRSDSAVSCGRKHRFLAGTPYRDSRP